MALQFDADGEQVNHGSAAGIDSIATGTVLYVFRPSAVSGNHHLFRKNGTEFSRLLITATGNVELGIERSGVDLTVLTNSTPVAANVWQVVAATWIMSGSNANQHVYHGNLGGAITAQTYTTQLVGDGTHDDSAGNWIVGHNGINGAGAFRGVIARQMVWTRHLTLGEIITAAYGYLPGAVMHSEYGWNGVGTQPDYSGNGNAGTVTGATLSAVHAPLALPWDDAEDHWGIGGTGTHPTIAPHSPIGWDEDVGWEGAFTTAAAAAPDPFVTIQFRAA